MSVAKTYVHFHKLFNSNLTHYLRHKIINRLLKNKKSISKQKHPCQVQRLSINVSTRWDEHCFMFPQSGLVCQGQSRNLPLFLE